MTEAATWTVHFYEALCGLTVRCSHGLPTVSEPDVADRQRGNSHYDVAQRQEADGERCRMQPNE